ncbi:DNA-binding transcriptional regulator, LysR family [Izhakiella capsodis]|uniref:DNA-binding transcriptional regulator, LysR family n=1 Tax=Izhakiella capsodis TaxID=1367852 RepID=A0A1I5ACE1_9GAMM|nr:LysR family transcriptional regulator [Izhakiella capsodis]SFN60116.1 DNA-binding transcriptional regulator, LysR family [Izhakiella capsodis]
MISFTLLQLEAFVAVCRHGTMTRAAQALRKDRTTVSELINCLEIDLGCELFDRQTRPPRLTPSGDRLYRQAVLFLQEAQAFSGIASQLAGGESQSLQVSYDVFIPHSMLVSLSTELAKSGVTVNLRCEPRSQGEQALAEGRADIGIYQALNRPVGQSFSWQTLGAIEFAVYASPMLFSEKPVTMMALASHTQLLPWDFMPEYLAQRLQIADHTQSANERELLIALLQARQGWAMLPTHFFTRQKAGVERIETVMGRKGMLHPVVALWQPGKVGHTTLRHVLDVAERSFTV